MLLFADPQGEGALKWGSRIHVAQNGCGFPGLGCCSGLGLTQGLELAEGVENAPGKAGYHC